MCSLSAKWLLMKSNFPLWEIPPSSRIREGWLSPMQKDEWIKLSDCVCDWHFALDGLNDEAWRPAFKLVRRSLSFSAKKYFGVFRSEELKLITSGRFHRRTFLVEVVFHDVRELPDGLERLADLQFKRSIEYCLLHGLNIKEVRKIHVNKVQTVSRAPICPRGNMSYFQPYPVNNTISTLNNT